jgi:phosphoribosylformimino-5-aminoimidazole carboxamide ribotide isomerase
VSPRTTSTFTILPAIDLRGDRVVRLRQGDFAHEQVYADDPVPVAAGFAAAGADWIHVVDLDGARAGERRQAATIDTIVASFAHAGPRLEVAGGIRTGPAIDDLLAAGVDRVVLGTIALRDPALVEAAIARHGPERIVVAVDVRDGFAVGDGWLPGASGVPVAQILSRFTAIGVTTFAVTAIARDGLLGGPDLTLLESCVNASSAAVVASGGIRSIADLEAIRGIGCRGAIVGRAIYEGGLDLAAAIAAMKSEPA